ncbi:helix-turn-helix domain-containing protein [Variovorax sp. CY25R-8]|uniref:helix-turn-helix domain-containing protein n=1 Tax=Variovorax sp. CY25R-8 TaxID=2855501 RepID=UPI0021BAC82A|nr:helix-turn-helix domain-containing protein [Variovorax sp. CY25R-8]MCT8178917.1 helix-turn-helix domain-containing protein [Variovorax sp. CY25R-8]
MNHAALSSSTANSQVSNSEATSTELQEKWGQALDRGFVLIPIELLRRQKELALADNDLVVLLNLLSHWWYSDDKPYPRTATIAARMGASPRTVQRCLEKLEAKNLIARVKGHVTMKGKNQTVTRYDLQGTVTRLKGYALTPLAKVPAAAPANPNYLAGMRRPASDAISVPLEIMPSGRVEAEGLSDEAQRK